MKTIEITFEQVRIEASRTYSEINSFDKNAMAWHIWKNAFDRCCIFLSDPINHSLKEAKEEIERLKCQVTNEDIGVWIKKVAEKEKDLDNLRKQIIADGEVTYSLQQSLASKDKEINELKKEVKRLEQWDRS